MREIIVHEQISRLGLDEPNLREMQECARLSSLLTGGHYTLSIDIDNNRFEEMSYVLFMCGANFPAHVK